MSFLRKRSSSMTSEASSVTIQRSRRPSLKSSLGVHTPFPIAELLPSKFYFTVTDGAALQINPVPQNGCAKSQTFTVDHELVYEPFASDFGPLNLGMLHSYFEKVRTFLQGNRPVVHYSSNDPRKRANAVFLACAYLVIHCDVKPKEAVARIVAAGFNTFLPFRDASSGPCSYKCTIVDCLEGLHRAWRLGWYDPSTFDKEQYHYYEKVDNGDLNWIIPGKFIAFAGPHSDRLDGNGYLALMPEDYYDVFNELGISLIVRLNKKCYDRRRFTNAGFAHADLYFPDGSCPPDQIISTFLSLCENAPSAVAVHCKAGLGRTGCLIGIYAMKHHGFPAREWIGWNRICRPGSILGPQQQFLCDVERIFLRRSSVTGNAGNLDLNCSVATLNERILVEGTTSAEQGRAAPSGTCIQPSRALNRASCCVFFEFMKPVFEASIRALPIVGSSRTYPVRRVYCIGRNYTEHAIEVGLGILGTGGVGPLRKHAAEVDYALSQI
ncbi:Dual specificity protein phosphatase cdc14a, variant 2 [Perkinsus olseni]|uniref:protein-tyrosine-phosphatase n=1 Tax=Perkinsus olseni TaxID=32597 RepID=A0A7J6NQY1_PEROL|nr:Dual specificity protein phosphatase cdc14a, variant 2 [Perkinsus olseni]